MVLRWVLLSGSYAVNSGPDNGSIEGATAVHIGRRVRIMGSDFDRFSNRR